MTARELITRIIKVAISHKRIGDPFAASPKVPIRIAFAGDTNELLPVPGQHQNAAAPGVEPDIQD
jgi:hypothetical protein